MGYASLNKVAVTLTEMFTMVFLGATGWESEVAKKDLEGMLAENFKGSENYIDDMEDGIKLSLIANIPVCTKRETIWRLEHSIVCLYARP